MNLFLCSIALTALFVNSIVQSKYIDVVGIATEVRGDKNISKAQTNLAQNTVAMNLVLTSTPPSSAVTLTPDPLNLKTLSLDWREKNAVTEPLDQGNCNSGWAFAAVGMFEGQYSIQFGELKQFSTSQVVDCAGQGRGCNGVLLDKDPRYFNEAGGLELEASYPYHNQDGQEHECAYNESAVVKFATVSIVKGVGHEQIESLARNAPVLVGINPAKLGSYNGNIIRKDDEGCNPIEYSPMHNVLIVGFNNEAPIPYWIVKNSYGTKWGDNGYFKIEKGVNACGIETIGTITILA